VLDDEHDKDPDQFGFMQTSAFIQLEKKYLKSVRRTVKRRERKWEKMFQNFQRSRGKKLPNRVYKGVPKSMRPRLWEYFLDVDGIKRKYADRNLDYQTLYKRGQK